MATEEAELWEQIQFILTDGAMRGLEGQELVEYSNKRFTEDELKASLALKADGYELNYGIYTRKVALFKSDLTVEVIFAEVKGEPSDWEYVVKEDGTLKLTGYKREKTGNITIPNIINGQLVTEIGQFFNSSRNNRINTSRWNRNNRCLCV